MANTRSANKKQKNAPQKDDQPGARSAIKLQEKELEIANLKKQLLQAKAGRHAGTRAVTPAKPNKMTDEQKRWFRNICDANKKFNWGKVKFCNSEEKLVKLTANIFDQWNLKEYEDLTGEDREEAKAEWIAENKEMVRLAMNDVRNYAQSQLRAFIVERRLKGQWVPTPEQIRKCALRDESILTDEKMQEVFAMYHDSLLFKVCGKEHWDSWMRWYNTISGPKGNVEGAEPNVSINTEAFLVATYENCDDKWKLIYELQRDGKKDPKRTDPRFKTDYIDSDAGQARWGGWNKKGRKAVKDLYTLIKDAREQDHVAQIEQKALQDVRILHDVEERDRKRAEKKGKKRKAPDEDEDEEDDEFDDL